MIRIFKTCLLAFIFYNSHFTLANATTLADIYELALKNDPTLKAAEASYRATAEARQQSRAALLPQITASIGYEKNDTESRSNQLFNADPVVVGSVLNSADSNSEIYAARVNQTLFDLSTWFSFKQGKALSKSARATFSAQQQEQIVRVAEAYFNVLRAIDQLSFAKAEEKSIKRQLEQTQQRFDVGLIAITDVHEAQAAYDLTIANRLTQENSLVIAKESLSAITGQNHENLWLLKENFVVSAPSPADITTWTEYALENNQTLAANRFAVDAAKQNNRARRSAHLPTISGQYSYNKRDNNSDNIANGTAYDGDAESEADTIAITVDIPLFSGGRTSSQRRQSAYEYNNAFETMISSQRTILQSTRSLYLTTATNVATVKARKNAILSSQSALEATTSGYRVGTRNIVDLLNAQTDLYRAQSSYANSRYDYIINLFKLKEAAGTLSPNDIYELNAWLTEPKAPALSDISK